MRSPVAAATAAAFQFGGWICQLFAVWAAMEAFGIHLPISAAGLVLVLMNVATIFPLWPGNFGLVQIAVAFPLTNYGVEYAHGVAFGIGLQAIEASVGVGVGLIFLAREGLSYATLRDIDDYATRQLRGHARRRSPWMIALASPASLKGVLTPREAGAALATGMRRVAGVEARELPVADGGEGTALVLEQALGGRMARRRSSAIRSVVASRRTWLDAARRDGGRRMRTGRGADTPRCERARPAARLERAVSASSCSRRSCAEP